MKTILGLKAWNNSLLGCVLTIGNFDGVHVGHRALLRELGSNAKRLNVPSVVLTFDQHPSKVLRPETSVPRLYPQEDLVEQMRDLGVDYLVIEKFTLRFSQYTAEAFLDDLIVPKLHPQLILVGHDFALGRDRQGSFETLQRLASHRNFVVEKFAAISQNQEIVSSSLIRRLLADGNVAAVSSALGRPYAILGSVVRGDGRGQKLGFPTANLKTEAEVIPASGVYISLLRALGRDWPSVTNVGTKPTFHDHQDIQVETHILDGQYDLYGQEVQVRFLQRLRGELKFSTPHELIKQIEYDVSLAKKYFGN